MVFEDGFPFPGRSKVLHPEVEYRKLTHNSMLDYPSALDKIEESLEVTTSQLHIPLFMSKLIKQMLINT